MPHKHVEKRLLIFFEEVQNVIEAFDFFEEVQNVIEAFGP